MKKILLMSLMMSILLVSSVAMVMAVKPVDSPKTSHLYLYEKDPATWEIVDGAWGKVMYKDDSFVFNGHNLMVNTEYTLVSYCGWPNVEILGTATTNNGGNVNLAGSMITCVSDAEDEEGHNVKIWLVESSDLTGNAFNSWSPEEYLFENNLI